VIYAPIVRSFACALDDYRFEVFVLIGKFVSTVCCAIAIAACETPQPSRPLVDGSREKMSAADLERLDSVARSYIATYRGPKGPIYRFHVVSRDRVKVYYGPHIAAGPIGDVEWLDAKRVDNKWQIVDAIYPGEPSVDRQ